MSQQTAKFAHDQYELAPELLTPEITSLVCQYARLKQRWFREREIESSPTYMSGTHSVFGDTLMETLLLNCLGTMQEITSLELCPTYSHYRIYKPGDTLQKHTDRLACEISASICLGYQYNDVEKEYHWPLWIQTPSDGEDDDKIEIILQPGDAIVYQGCSLPHWRNRFIAGPNSWLAQVFLHYVDKNGPHYPEHAYDNRLGIGAPSLNRLVTAGK